jgi:hypothetical protein
MPTVPHMAARPFRSTWFVLSVIMLVDCGGSRGDKQDAARPVADGSAAVALLADSEPPISSDAAASAADAAESAIDPDAMSLDAALSVDEGPTRNTCTTEQRYPASPVPIHGHPLLPLWPIGSQVFFDRSLLQRLGRQPLLSAVQDQRRLPRSLHTLLPGAQSLFRRRSLRPRANGMRPQGSELLRRHPLRPTPLR